MVDVTKKAEEYEMDGREIHSRIVEKLAWLRRDFSLENEL